MPSCADYLDSLFNTNVTVPFHYPLSPSNGLNTVFFDKGVASADAVGCFLTYLSPAESTQKLVVVEGLCVVLC